jgi:GTP-binding protein Era
LVLFLVEPSRPNAETKAVITERLRVKTPVILVINKIDTIRAENALEVINEYQKLYDFAEIVPVSALRGDNLGELTKTLSKHLPAGVKYYPDDEITDQTERVITAEIIREKALNLLSDEIPHGIAVSIETMRERQDSELIHIEANIFCER